MDFDFDGGYDGFGRDDDYNIWEENELFRDEVAEREAAEADDTEAGADGWHGMEDSYLDSYWEDQFDGPYFGE